MYQLLRDINVGWTHAGSPVDSREIPAIQSIPPGTDNTTLSSSNMAHYSRVIFCASGSGPTLQQCHKTSRIFAENKRILRVAIEVLSFFKGLFSKEKDLWLFGRAPSAFQKALLKSQKGPFSRKWTIKMMSPLTLRKSAKSQEYPWSSVTLLWHGAVV